MRTLLTAAAAVLLLGVASPARADVVWVGDFETNDLEQWSFAENPAHTTIVASPVVQGTHAARIQLTNDAVWPNGLKRVELQHLPAAGRTGEGKTLFFAYSFFLPAELPSTPSAQIGYWESNSSYQQMMAFEVKGKDITFTTRKPQNHVAWDAKGIVTAGVWHRIAMKVLWSTSGGTGKVDVWFDGAQVVADASAQTRADDNALFTQLGLLRGAIEFTDAPIIVIDDAVEGDSLADVRPAPTSADAGTYAGDGAVAPGPSDAGTTPAPTGAAPSTSTKEAPSDDGGCNTTGTGVGSSAGVVCALVLAARRRRRSRATVKCAPRP